MNCSQTYTLKFDNLKQLKKYYMPFIKDGGIFIVTSNEHAINDKIKIFISLLNEMKDFEVIGRVIWINPAFDQQDREQGIGINFESKNGLFLKNKIETLLVTIADENIKTATL